MRLALSVNNQQKARASLTGEGWLSAHINLSNRVEAESENQVRLTVIDTSEEPNAIHSEWGGFPLLVGDRVMIEVLDDGESDAPDEVRKTSENPDNLFSSREQARQLLDAVRSCDVALMEVINRAKEAEPEEEFSKLAIAVGSVFAELDRQLISPTLRRHPDLLSTARDVQVR